MRGGSGSMKIFVNNNNMASNSKYQLPQIKVDRDNAGTTLRNKYEDPYGTVEHKNIDRSMKIPIKAKSN